MKAKLLHDSSVESVFPVEIYFIISGSAHIRAYASKSLSSNPLRISLSVSILGIFIQKSLAESNRLVFVDPGRLSAISSTAGDEFDGVALRRPLE